MDYKNLIIVVLCLVSFVLLVFYLHERLRYQGGMLKNSNGLDELYRVVSKDQRTTVLQDYSADQKRYLITSEIFYDGAIRPGDDVKRMPNSDYIKEHGRRSIKSCGAPFVKVEIRTVGERASH